MTLMYEPPHGHEHDAPAPPNHTPGSIGRCACGQFLEYVYELGRNDGGPAYHWRPMSAWLAKRRLRAAGIEVE